MQANPPVRGTSLKKKKNKDAGHQSAKMCIEMLECVELSPRCGSAMATSGNHLAPASVKVEAVEN